MGTGWCVRQLVCAVRGMRYRSGARHPRVQRLQLTASLGSRESICRSCVDLHSDVWLYAWDLSGRLIWGNHKGIRGSRFAQIFFSLVRFKSNCGDAPRWKKMEFQYAVPSSAQHTQGTGGTWGSGLPARRTTHAPLTSIASLIFFSHLHYRSNRRCPELLYDYFQVFRTVSH